MSKLKFTGNWFFDAGVLGFVNLMEEVYGWGLDEIERRIRDEPINVYYGYFPFGYLFYHSRVRTIEKEIADIENKLKKSKKKSKSGKVESDKKSSEFKNTIKQYSDEISEKEKTLKCELETFRKDADNKVPGIIEKIEKNKEEIATVKTIQENGEEMQCLKNEINSLIQGFKLKLPKDIRNFFIFNSKETKSNLYNSFIYLYFLLKEDYERLYNFVSSIGTKKDNLTYEKYPDSTINPFLYSPREFSNIGYTKPPEATLIKEQLHIEQPLFLLLLPFGYSFQFIGRENIMFYTNSLEGSYAVYKKLALYKEKRGQKADIFKITWSAIIDALTEKKADFSLENMYLIEFAGIENLKLKDVEYISIPRLQASILLDDTIRDELNIYIRYGNKNSEKTWLLEEFIKGKPLYPIILNYINSVLNQGEDVFSIRRSSLYSLIVESKILEFKAKHSTNNLFSSEYFDNYKALVGEIKNEARSSLFYAGFINQISADENVRRNMGRELLEALRAKNKIIFLNILLKNINESSNIGAIESFMDWIFNRIIVNNISWEMYALLLIANLISNSK